MSINTSRLSCARILVVDDSGFDRQLISMALKKAGFSNMMTADDGADALLKTYEFRPDLVLLDLCMPNVDGYAYCEKVRSDASLPKMPIIVQTASEDRESRLRALSSGADDFLTKPLDMDELALRIRIQVERYFMFRDMQDMCGYLKMEVETVQNIRQHVSASPSSANDLENHFEVLSQLVSISAG